MRIAEFEQRIICGTFRIKISAKYTWSKFRIPYYAFRKIHRPWNFGLVGRLGLGVGVKTSLVMLHGGEIGA